MIWHILRLMLTNLLAKESDYRFSHTNVRLPLNDTNFERQVVATFLGPILPTFGEVGTPLNQIMYILCVVHLPPF